MKYSKITIMVALYRNTRFVICLNYMKDQLQVVQSTNANMHRRNSQQYVTHRITKRFVVLVY